jgi:PncC family amidohydrolase
MERAERVGQLLVQHGWRISLVESTAGGLISAALLKVPGASRYYEQGVIAYTKAGKVNTVGMPAELYTERGSVHREAVQVLAENIRRLNHTEVGVAESGVAGPGTGRSGLPIGTVWAAVVTPEHDLQRELHLPGNRAQIMDGIVDAVLAMLEEVLAPPQTA